VIHPARRRRAAQLSSGTLVIDSDVLRNSLAHLALEIQQRGNSGSMSKRDASTILAEFLQHEELGLDLAPREAREQAAAILSHASDSAGILVAPSLENVSFYHRVLQEYLAAEALAALPKDRWRGILKDTACDPRWHEVLASLASALQSRDDVRQLVEDIRATATGPLKRLLVAPLLAEIAFGSPRCPPRLAKELAVETLDMIELGDSGASLSFRLMDAALGGLRSGPAQVLVRARLGRWLPRLPTYRDQIYSAIGQWPPSEVSIACLVRGLRDEHMSEARSAAQSLVQLAGANALDGSRLMAEASNAVSPRLRAVLLEAMLADPARTPPSALQLAMADKDSRSELAFPAARARIQTGSQSTRDRDRILELAQWHSPIGHEWKDEIDALLTLGWPGSSEVRDLCMSSLFGFGPQNIEPRVARRTLVRGYTGDAKVAELLAAEIRDAIPRGDGVQRFLPHDMELWPLFADFAHGSQQICEAMDAWLPTDEHHVVEAHWAALTARSPIAREVMLKALNRPSPHWAARALLVGWSHDEEVRSALEAMARGPAERAQEIAGFFGRILVNPGECRARLLRLLQTPGLRRLDFVLRGLADSRAAAPESDVVSAILDAHQRHDELPFGRVRWMLIANWHDDPRVQSLAEAELNEDDCNLTVVALAAAHLEPLREAVLDRLGVLPTPLRLALAVRLRENTDDPAVRQVLRRYRSEDDESVRTALALSYYDRTATDDTTSIAQLRAELSAVGATMDAVTGAAFAALLAMGRLDVFVQARRGTDSAVPVTVQTGGGFRFNAPLWRKVAAHWGELKEALGANLFVRLEPAGEAAVWACLARVAVRGSDSAKDLYEHLLSIPGNAPLDAVHLQFLERQGAPGARLRDGCLATMARATRANRIDDASLIASEILGRAFAGDEVVLQRLAIPTGADEIHRGLGDLCLPLVSICEGWPDSAELDRIFRCLQERKLTLPPFAACAVIARRSQVSRVVSATRDFCGPFLRHDRRVGVALTGRFFSRRLRDDTEAFEAISDVAEDSKTSTAEAVALLRLLTEARGLTRRLRATCETRATAALGPGDTLPALTRDPVTGAVCAVPFVLTELLLAGSAQN
jgi:hypothetical protein